MSSHLRYCLFIVLIAAGCGKADIRTSPAPPPPPPKDPDGYVSTGHVPDAEFKGGASAWLKFLSSNIKYPDSAVNAEIQGTIHVRFIIERDGKVSNIQPLEGARVLQDEAVRVISLSSGNWQPAMQAGRTVRTYKTQPIVFQLKVD